MTKLVPLRSSRADRSMQGEDQLGLSTSSNLFPNLINQWQTPGMPGSSVLPSTDVKDITIEAVATFDAEYHSLFRQDTGQKTKEHIFGVVCGIYLVPSRQNHTELPLMISSQTRSCPIVLRSTRVSSPLSCFTTSCARMTQTERGLLPSLRVAPRGFTN